MAQTYTDLIERAVFMAHKYEPTTAIDRFKATAEAVFPSVVEELAQSVANDLAHPWRAILHDVTDGLTNGATIPAVGANGKQIIGIYGMVRDADNSQLLSDGFTEEEIRTFTDNVGNWRFADMYAYVITKPRIYHTREEVVVDVCVLDEADIATAIAANAVPIFPDAEGAYVTALVGKLLQGGPPFIADDKRLLAA